jgi:hypothetical protein
LPRSSVLLDHPRAGHVIYTLRNALEPGPTGLPGVTLLDASSDLAVGAGMHGGLNPGEMSTVLMLSGSAIRPGASSDWPAGLVDIAPTILALLGLDGGAEMDGRVLGETFLAPVEPTSSLTPETWEASGDGYAQRVARVRVGRHVWIENGTRLFGSA